MDNYLPRAGFRFLDLPFLALPDLRKIPTAPESPEERISSVSNVNISIDIPPSDNKASASLLDDPETRGVLRKSGINSQNRLKVFTETFHRLLVVFKLKIINPKIAKSNS